MGRNYLIIIVAIGLFGSILSQGSPRSSGGAKESVAKAANEADESSSSAAQYSSSTRSQEGTIELERSSDGHFYADVQINGAAVRMLVDTGASGIALTRDDARSAGIATSIGMNDVIGEGASGSVHGEYVTIDRIELGHKRGENMEAAVLSGGRQSLLGQQFLSKFESVEIRDDRMVLR